MALSEPCGRWQKARGVLAEAASIEQALERLRELREALRRLHEMAVLRGQAADEAAFTRAAALLLRDAKGYEHNAFKIDLAQRGIVRALTQAARGMPQSQSNKKVL